MNASTESEKILKYHGKTFYFAQRFLGRKSGYAVARLYRFCRYVDDLADESSDKEKAEDKLNNIRLQLIEKQASDPLVQDFIELADDWQINLSNANDLVEGVISDLGIVALQSQSELLQYCYRVAGTVGLMMCPLLYAEKKGVDFALDLGIAMQLTNIARDVLYDARQNRRYIPAEWIKGLSAAEITALRKEDSSLIQNCIQRTLALAETYYQSGAKGYAYLPMRSRISIAIAARTYRQIGIKLLKNECEYWRGRTYTTLAEKIMLAAMEVVLNTFNAPFLKKVTHKTSLHDDLTILYSKRSKGEGYSS